MLDINKKYLEMVVKYPSLVRKFSINEFQIAEMLTIKENSLWYTQVNNWIDNPPNISDAKVRKMFQEEAKIFKESIENDYRIPDKYNGVAYLAIEDFLNIIRQLHQNSLMVISQWFYIVGELILLNSKDKKKELKRVTPTQGKLQKCIAINCDVEVNPSVKKSGACCIEHTRYYCKECECWHHFGTKIANSHYDYKAFNWIKNKEERNQAITSLRAEKIIEANSKSSRLIFNTPEEKLEFIRSCEKTYKKTTENHIIDHQNRGFEGNVDERKWYRIAMELKEEGLL